MQARIFVHTPRHLKRFVSCRHCWAKVPSEALARHALPRRGGSSSGQLHGQRKGLPALGGSRPAGWLVDFVWLTPQWLPDQWRRHSIGGKKAVSWGALSVGRRWLAFSSAICRSSLHVGTFRLRNVEAVSRAPCQHGGNENAPVDADPRWSLEGEGDLRRGWGSQCLLTVPSFCTNYRMYEAACPAQSVDLLLSGSAPQRGNKQ